MKFYLVLIYITLLFSSCLQRPMPTQQQRILDANGKEIQAPATSNANPAPKSNEKIYWFTTVPFKTNLTIPFNFSTAMYLRGPALNDFLKLDSNFIKTYCVTVNFNLGTSSNITTLKIRSVPVVFTNFSDNTSERLLRVDANATDELPNSINCVGNDAGNPAIAYKVNAVCPSCTVPITSTKMFITDATLDLSHLSLTLGPNSTEDNSNENGTCSDSICKLKGLDCCSGEKHCIKDGFPKDNASTFPDYNQAMSDIAQNKATFAQYPHLFYSCGDKKLPKEKTVDPNLPTTQEQIAAAKAHLEKMKGYYYCLQGALKNPPDYTDCTSTQDESAYNTVKNAIWDLCQCSTLGDPAPLDPQNTCPTYNLVAKDASKAILTSLVLPRASDSERIKSVECVTKNYLDDQAPFQNLKIDLWTRSVPHRYFSTSPGVGIDDIATLDSTIANNLQEGTPFYYQDTINKTQAEMGPFSMNAILGSMNIDLSQAYPAKAIKLKKGLVYAIAVTDGVYTPCPGCAKDAWNGALSGFPSSNNGLGLQGIGFSTSRDVIGTNLQLANYEDTRFGRACFVPPTMLPFSHAEKNFSTTQRRDRLSTQAALFINGYQRDWFGFNYGSVIGSFNGVTWFAIGNNRRVQATSDTLYLAINAPFGDLAQTTTISMQVIQDSGFSKIPKYDWDTDPTITANSPMINRGASCQKFHQCSTDSDCISNLGWEYTCANVGPYKTNWPLFNNTSEVSNDSLNLTIFKILQGGISSNSSLNRCVYRGSGSLCSVKSFNLSPSLKPLFTCAPNFYCASIDSSEFNSVINRNPNEIVNIYYGFASTRLGRPLNYVGASDQLSDEIKFNIKANATKLGITDVGMCIPARSTHLIGLGSPKDNHQMKDSAKRTDYVGQIAGCNASIIGGANVALNRVHGCPLLDTNGNYVFPDSKNSYVADDKYSLINQNSCGNETLHNTLTGNLASPFNLIELETLSSLATFDQPGMAKDACFRRAGSVCHTDLDCSPNYLHAQKALVYDLDYFGNTLAESQYWQEYLVCGQGQTPPMPNTTDKSALSILQDYKLNNNKCCREVGKSLTIYTQGDPETSSDNPLLDTSFTGLSIENPKKAGRYSRYSILEKDFIPVKIASNVTPIEKQALSINAVGTKSCCGGGFIRKFADGGHDWLQGSRNNFDISQFWCLNFRTDLFHTAPSSNPPNYETERSYFCADAKNKGCIQYNIGVGANGGSVQYPKEISIDSSSAGNGSYLNCTSGTCKLRVHTIAVRDPDNDNIKWMHDLAPFNPLLVESNDLPVNLAISPKVVRSGVAGFTSSTQEMMVIHLPSYINGITDLKKVYYSQRHETKEEYYYDVDTIATATTPGSTLLSNLDGVTNCAKAVDNLDDYLSTATTDPQGWCYVPSKNWIVIKRSAPPTASKNPLGGAILEFVPYGINEGRTPGNDLYILKKLERFQLLGIPQIYLEPLYCSSNKNTLVPELFQSEITTRTQFEAHSSIMIDSSISDLDIANSSKKVIPQNQAQSSAIFSSHEFTCCKPLGFKSANPTSECCSGFGEAIPNETQFMCAIPAKVDLHLYFNQFVSNEGTQSHIDKDRRLVTTDFDSKTGFPKDDLKVFNKILLLGKQFCKAPPGGGSGTVSVKSGGAFGNFSTSRISQSFSGSDTGTPPYGIIFGSEDQEIKKTTGASSSTSTQGTKGSQAFSEGYLFNNHLYCVYE